MISGVRQDDYYKAIQYINISEEYPIEKMCQKLSVNRAAYYKFLHREPSSRQLENEKIVEWIKELYEEQDGILGYRQMTITVNREHNVHYNKKIKKSLPLGNTRAFFDLIIRNLKPGFRETQKRTSRSVKAAPAFKQQAWVTFQLRNDPGSAKSADRFPCEKSRCCGVASADNSSQIRSNGSMR